MLRPGMLLQERYQILEQIGSGGMSVVYKAKCNKLNRLVAIKLLKEEFSSDANFVRKFKMEAQAAARLSHPNIVNVYDVVDEGAMHYIVMELIEGVTLKSYIAKKGRLEWKETIGIAIQVAQGMAAAHEQHIIHRDIKPQNMIISKDGKVKVADFGIARAASSQTISSNAMGSVHYISPEQARGGYSDERSDIYSFGITMYEMVTGKLPFEGENTVTVALAHLEDPITSPRKYNPGIPDSLEKIILKCTQKKPEMRYHNATEVINDLRRSLVSPDGDFVKTMPFMDRTAQTVTISQEELVRIKEGKHQDYNHKEMKPQPQNLHSNKQKEDKQDVNPQIEKLMTAVGVVVAILIVAVLIFVVAKLGGIFNLGSGENKGTIATTPSAVVTTEQQQPDDTQIPMPDVLGLPEDLAEAKLKESFLIMRISNYNYSDTYEKGHVMEQEIPKGSNVAKYSTVYVTVSNGPETVDISKMGLLELDSETAKKMLEEAELTVRLEEEAHETIAQGNVISYSPEKVKIGGTITLKISSGLPVEMVLVPNITGQKEEIAIGMLEDAGLIPGEASMAFSDTVPKGSLISQEIVAESELGKGSPVSYVVSNGPEKPKYYIGSISETYALKDVFGPGSSTSSIQIAIRLKQHVDGQDKYTTLMEPVTLTGDTVLPIQFSKIEGAYGVDTGEVQIVDVGNNNMVLKSYPVTFLNIR